MSNTTQDEWQEKRSKASKVRKQAPPITNRGSSRARNGHGPRPISKPLTTDKLNSAPQQRAETTAPQPVSHTGNTNATSYAAILNRNTQTHKKIEPQPRPAKVAEERNPVANKPSDLPEDKLAAAKKDGKVYSVEDIEKPFLEEQKGKGSDIVKEQVVKPGFRLPTKGKSSTGTEGVEFGSNNAPSDVLDNLVKFFGKKVYTAEHEAQLLKATEDKKALLAENAKLQQNSKGLQKDLNESMLLKDQLVAVQERADQESRSRANLEQQVTELTKQLTDTKEELQVLRERSSAAQVAPKQTEKSPVANNPNMGAPNMPVGGYPNMGPPPQHMYQPYYGGYYPFPQGYSQSPNARSYNNMYEGNMPPNMPMPHPSTQGAGVDYPEEFGRHSPGPVNMRQESNTQRARGGMPMMDKMPSHGPGQGPPGLAPQGQHAPSPQYNNYMYQQPPMNFQPPSGQNPPQQQRGTGPAWR